jgi:hypothetical protein
MLSISLPLQLSFAAKTKCQKPSHLQLVTAAKGLPVAQGIPSNQSSLPEFPVTPEGIEKSGLDNSAGPAFIQSADHHSLLKMIALVVSNPHQCSF